MRLVQLFEVVDIHMENSTKNNKLNKAVVYIAEIPKNQEIGQVYPSERDLEISACTNPILAKQKYFVWDLLSYALKQTIGKDVSKASVYKDIDGVWRSKEICFSLSHSKNAIAVAVSNYPVGVDIERVDARINDRLAKRIFTEHETKRYQRLNDIAGGTACKPTEQTQVFDTVMFLAKKWTEKESIFKQTQCKTPICQIETSNYNTYSADVDIDGEKYACSVAFEQGLEIDVRFKLSK